MWSLASVKDQQLAGRFAPTPTGALHVGNAYSALLSYISAKAQGGRAILRVDDLDVRSLPKGCLDGQLNDLEWLGLKFDEGIREGGTYGPYRQSLRSELYESAIKYLNQRGLIYLCYCSRKEIAAIAPHAQDEGVVYPGTCRPQEPTPLDLEIERYNEVRGRRPTLRFNVTAYKVTNAWCAQEQSHIDPKVSETRELSYIDLVYGHQSAHIDDHVGDFVLQRRDGVYAYQLACAVDDHLQACSLVARGADLITSTHRQRLILSALEIPERYTPQYAHAGLIVDESGERLAKRRQSTQLRGLREAGIKASHIRAALSRALGGPDTDDLKQMISDFEWSQVSDRSVKWSL